MTSTATCLGFSEKLLDSVKRELLTCLKCPIDSPTATMLRRVVQHAKAYSLARVQEFKLSAPLSRRNVTALVDGCHGLGTRMNQFATLVIPFWLERPGLEPESQQA